MGLELFFCVTERSFFIVMNLFISRNIKNTQLFSVTYLKYTNVTNTTFADFSISSSENLKRLELSVVSSLKYRVCH